MPLSDHVHIARRFQRSVRIDTDIHDDTALNGYIFSSSAQQLLFSMTQHISENSQGAFTWTGPYGCGKSSLAILVSGLLGEQGPAKKAATRIVGKEVASRVLTALNANGSGFRFLPVIGRRGNPVRTFRDAIDATGLSTIKNEKDYSEDEILSIISEIAGDTSDGSSGLLVFVDEMGKFLESALYEDSDIYFFQRIAETASRSNGRLVFVGILHQSFAEYASRLSRDLREEWSKIQGRFIDLAINSAGEEQLELISKSIVSDYTGSKSQHSATISQIIAKRKPSVATQVKKTLQDCWPLHPVVACLLGPISRRRFGQNQRSIFGFLNSAEPNGFQEFLRNGATGDLFEPHSLWDYLRVNLEPAILASPDGHRWATATEAIERCEILGGDVQDIKILKTIAVVDMFKEGSGLVPSIPLLTCIVKDRHVLDKSVHKLLSWSLIIFKKFSDSFSIYAGSDFNIDRAVDEMLNEIADLDFSVLRNIAGVQPILAKRYYDKSGALWWFDVEVAPLNKVPEIVGKSLIKQGTLGRFVLAIPTEGETTEEAASICRNAAEQEVQWQNVIGISKGTWGITSLARELVATEKVLAERAELAGDAVARKEVTARIVALQAQLEVDLSSILSTATWFVKGGPPRDLQQKDLNLLASELTEKKLRAAPLLKNELLNRIKPSPSAISAQNALLQAMVKNYGKRRLGINGFPAEGGLFASLLEATGLYTETPDGWQLVAPERQSNNNLYPMWAEGRKHLKKNSHRTVVVSEIYDIWREKVGAKDGLFPVFIVAFILSEYKNLAFYRHGYFQPQFRDLDVEVLAKDPSAVQLRWMDLSEISRRLLSEMADIVAEHNPTMPLINLSPLDIGRGLIAVFEQLQPWVVKTMRLSKNAVIVRDLFKKANDPNKFIFDDIPRVLGTENVLVNSENLPTVVTNLREGLRELREAYPNLLHQIENVLLAELQVPNTSPQSLEELRDRAKNVMQTTGDLELEAFITRLSRFEGTNEQIEGIAGIGSKPVRDWIDLDIDRAILKLSMLAQKFLRVETFARVKGRKDKRHSVAVIVGINGRPTPVSHEFEVTDKDQEAVNEVVAQVQTALRASKATRPRIILAALAELSARYMQEA